MVTAGTKLRGSKGPTVGRKRKPQTKEVAKTLKGRFGSRLSALATKAGFDADGFGDKIGKSGDTVNLYYSGRVIPPLNDWPKIAKVLGVSVRDLIPE